MADRINKLLEYVPAEGLGVTTDCGLILLQRYIAMDKLHALVAGTELVREKLGKAARLLPARRPRPRRTRPVVP